MGIWPKKRETTFHKEWSASPPYVLLDQPDLNGPAEIAGCLVLPVGVLLAPVVLVIVDMLLNLFLKSWPADDLTNILRIVVMLPTIPLTVVATIFVSSAVSEWVNERTDP